MPFPLYIKTKCFVFSVHKGCGANTVNYYLYSVILIRFYAVFPPHGHPPPPKVGRGRRESKNPPPPYMYSKMYLGAFTRAKGGTNKQDPRLPPPTCTINVQRVIISVAN